MTDFYKGKSVFVTGHTGFKGAWLCHILKYMGADVYGYALEPVRDGVYKIADVSAGMSSVIGDVRDIDKLTDAFNKAKPEIVFHLAAQPIVLDSYKRPVYTFETNILGTVNILECIRNSDTVRSAVIVTTDKVYKNDERNTGFHETDELGGTDPYAASKSCAEIVSESYRISFLQNTPLSTVRSGNVLGGGDVSENRIIPDCLRAVTHGNEVFVRNPKSVRPYQHVLEPLMAYLLIAAGQYNDSNIAGSYNIGPDESGCLETGELADLFCKHWGSGLSWTQGAQADIPHESSYLRLDCSKIRSLFGWQPVWDVEQAIIKTIEWEKLRNNKDSICAVMNRQIDEYLASMKQLPTKQG